MCKSIYLESENLVIRSSHFADCNLFSQWETRDYVNQYFTINKNRNYEEIVKEFIIREEDPTKIQLTIEHKQHKKPIGRLYLSNFNRAQDYIDITRIYIGEKEYLGKGYGKEAMQIMLKYCFDELDLERVTLDFYDGNEKARNLYEKLGFKHEGKLRNAAKKDDKYFNLNLMSLLREEYCQINGEGKEGASGRCHNFNPS